MRNAWLIAKRELAAYLRSPMGYVIAAVVLFVDGLWFNSDYVAGGPAKYSADVLQAFFAFATFMAMVAGVLLAMRLFAEEKQLRTLAVLLTSPVRERHIVLGKFISGFIFYALITLATIYMPLLIFVNGKVSVGHIACGYLGLLMLGALAIAVGLLGSALAPNQIVSAVLGAAIVTALYWCFKGAALAESPIREVLAYISPHHHLQWQTGVLHTRDILYFASGVFLFLLLTTQVLHARRWR